MGTKPVREDPIDWPARPRKVPSVYSSPTWIVALLSLLLLFLALMIVIIVALLFVMAINGKANMDGVLMLGGIAVIFALIPGGIGFWLARLVRRKRQQIYAEIQAERDGFAAAVAAMLERGEPPPPFSLYLRPFFTDGELTADEGHARLLAVDVTEIADYGQVHDTERAMAQAMEDHAPALSLGRPNDRLGAGRIETNDDHWKPLFEKLIAHASRVVMVPIGQPATMEEIRAIAGTPDLLAKTVFVRPANRKRKAFRFTPDPAIRSIRGMWNWTREQLADVLPDFPDFGRTPRLIAFPADTAPVEYRGNGVASVQLASGIRSFMTKGRTMIADGWLIAILFIMSALPALLYVPINLDPQNIGATLSGRYQGQSVSGAADTIFFFQMLVMSSLGLAAYKLVTNDLPYRIGLPLTAIWLLFIANSVFVGWVLPRAVAGEDFLVSPTIVANFLGNASFMIFGYIAVALVTNNALRIAAMLIPVGLSLICEISLASHLAEAGTAPVGMIVSVILLALAMVMPLWPRSDGAQRAGVTIAALVAGAAALGLLMLGMASFAQWQATVQQAAMDSSLFTLGPDLPGEYQMAVDSNWARLWRCMGFAIPIIAFAFVARAITGQGRTRQWAEPLPEYPG